MGRAADKLSQSSSEERPLKKNSAAQPHRSSGSLKGPLRALRLCLLAGLLPGLLLAGPLYLRYHVYAVQLYPLAMSDMRMLDNRVSTTWCQRQLVKVNTTFNAFLMPQAPQVSKEVKPLSMVRHLVLEDDMKEYWGFYLLKGSKVTVSTCVRWPGASLIVIRGHKHLHECAYIGDDSSEELDELLDTAKSTDEDAPSNTPVLMYRHRPDVHFHHPERRNHGQNHTLRADQHQEAEERDETDAKAMRSLLGKLFAKTLKDRQKAAGSTSTSTSPTPAHSDELLKDIQGKLDKLGDKGRAVLKKLIGQLGENATAESEDRRKVLQVLMANQTQAKAALAHKANATKRVRVRARPLKAPTTTKPTTTKPITTRPITTKPITTTQAGLEGTTEPIDTTTTTTTTITTTTTTTERRIAKLKRRKRELVLSTAMRDLNKHDEEANTGVEELDEAATPSRRKQQHLKGLFNPDGIADDRGAFNETTLNDRSNSEFWSSFSSSEEALLNCAGLILNLPLTPHRECLRESSDERLEDASFANTVTYKVPSNGYYFFVFNSENEVQPNYIRVKFDLEKTVYNVSNAVSRCSNTTEQCAVNLDFFSDEKLVLELPVKENETLWNEEFVVLSECEPRTALYVVCVISVPLVILLFAFQ